MPMVNAQRRPQAEPRCGVDRFAADHSADTPHGQRFLGRRTNTAP